MKPFHIFLPHHPIKHILPKNIHPRKRRDSQRPRALLFKAARARAYVESRGEVAQKRMLSRMRCAPKNPRRERERRRVLKAQPYIDESIYARRFSRLSRVRSLRTARRDAYTLTCAQQQEVSRASDLNNARCLCASARVCLCPVLTANIRNGMWERDDGSEFLE